MFARSFRPPIAFLTFFTLVPHSITLLHPHDYNNPSSSSQSNNNKLPIYDPPEPQYRIVDIPPSQLELAIRQSRHFIHQSILSTKNSLQSLVNQWIQVERSISHAAKSIYSPNERLMPATLYIAASAFTGSFLVRNRSLFLRSFTPSVLTITTAFILLPNTTNNTFTYLFNFLPSETRVELSNVVQATNNQIMVAQSKLSQVQDKAQLLTNDLKQSIHNWIPTPTTTSSVNVASPLLPSSSSSSSSATPINSDTHLTTDQLNPIQQQQQQQDQVSSSSTSTTDP